MISLGAKNTMSLDIKPIQNEWQILIFYQPFLYWNTCTSSHYSASDVHLYTAKVNALKYFGIISKLTYTNIMISSCLGSLKLLFSPCILAKKISYSFVLDINKTLNIFTIKTTDVISKYLFKQAFIFEESLFSVIVLSK